MKPLKTMTELELYKLALKGLTEEEMEVSYSEHLNRISNTLDCEKFKKQYETLHKQYDELDQRIKELEGVE